MSGRVMVLFALLAVLLQCCRAASSPAQAQEAGALRQLLAGREKARLLGSRQEPESPAESTRAVRRAHLSEDEREIMTKQIMQAISDMMLNPECLSDRDYQGWVDFGRRAAE